MAQIDRGSWSKKENKCFSVEDRIYGGELTGRRLGRAHGLNSQDMDLTAWTNLTKHLKWLLDI